MVKATVEKFHFFKLINAGRNIEDGISFVQTSESALLQIAALAQRLFEIGIQAGNQDLQSASDTNALNSEATALATAINLVASNQSLMEGMF